MGVGGISGGIDPVQATLLQAQQGSVAASANLLDAAMDTAASTMLQLLEALPEPGSGRSVDTYA